MTIVSRRAGAAYAHDIVMAAISFWLSFYLRVGDDIAHYSHELIWTYDLAFAATAAAVFYVSGLYRGIWRYASLPDLIALARAVTLVVLIYFPLMFLVTRLEALPRSTVGINWLVLMALLGGPRFAYRLLKDGSLRNILRVDASRTSVPVLLIGAGEGADLFIRTTYRDAQQAYRVVGIVSDDDQRVGREIGGVTVLGTVDTLPRVVERLAARGDKPQRMILTGRGLDGAAIRRLLDVADGLGIPLARLPRLTEFRDTRADENRTIEPVAIEDLLGRPQTVLDRASMRALIAGRRVLVTGAGGTIGSELTRQIAAFGPARLALFDNGEFALYSIEREILERHPDVPRAALIGDVRDSRRVDTVMAAERPELVFHAAALKHVPMVEANPLEGVCQALDVIEARRAGGTRFVTVRFGNVLGSTGSVVPLFQRQLAAGGPLTVTHPDISRYF